MSEIKPLNSPMSVKVRLYHQSRFDSTLIKTLSAFRDFWTSEQWIRDYDAIYVNSFHSNKASTVFPIINMTTDF